MFRLIRLATGPTSNSGLHIARNLVDVSYSSTRLLLCRSDKMTLLRGLSAFLLVSMLSMSSSYSPLTGVKVQKLGKNAKASEEVDLGKSLEASPRPTTLIIFGTYAADFNAIEYGQRLKHYMPALKSKGVEDVCLILNARPEACHSLAEFLDLPSDVQLYSDPLGAAGRAFGVSRGWMPDNESVSPYVKLFGMLVGLGAAMTLPYVIAGYIGNPRGHSGWIETSLATGMKQGRWPDTALELDQASGTVIGNKFAELP